MEVRTEAEHGVDALVVGAVDHAKPHRLRPSLRAIFASKGVPPKRVVEQFKVSPGAVLPVGAAIDVAHFVPGQHVDVIGTTVGWASAPPSETCRELNSAISRLKLGSIWFSTRLWKSAASASSSVRPAIATRPTSGMAIAPSSCTV